MAGVAPFGIDSRHFRRICAQQPQRTAPVSNLVAGIAVGYQVARKTLQESCRVFPTSIWLVLKETNRLAALFSAAIAPHPGLRGNGFSALLQYLYPCLIRIDDADVQQIPSQPPVAP